MTDRSEYMKTYREEHAEEHAEYLKEWRQKNKGKVAQYNQEAYKKGAYLKTKRGQYKATQKPTREEIEALSKWVHADRQLFTVDEVADKYMISVRTVQRIEARFREKEHD